MLLPFQNQRVTTRSLLTQGAKSVGTASLVATLVMGFSLPVFADSHGDDHYGKIQFAKPEYKVNEDDGSVTLWVKRTEGKSGQVMVKYGTTGASAMPGKDYKPTSGMLTWGDGDEKDKPIKVNIHPDKEDEGSEMFYVTLLDAMGNAGTMGDSMMGDGMMGDSMKGDGMMGDSMKGDGMMGDGMMSDGMMGDGMMGDSMKNHGWAMIGKRMSVKVKIEDSKMMEPPPPPPAPAPIESGTQLMFNSVLVVTQTVITRVVTRFRFKSVFRYRSANGDNFLNAFLDNLETFGLGEFWLENGMLLVPDATYRSLLSAHASEPTSVDSDLGIFADETTGLAYMVYDEDGLRWQTDLYPVLASVIVQGLMETFPDAILEQSAEGLAFTLGDTYHFTVPYNVEVEGLDTDGFSLEPTPNGYKLCNAGWCQTVNFQ